MCVIVIGKDNKDDEDAAEEGVEKRSLKWKEK
jgi:hypothetical protein